MNNDPRGVCSITAVFYRERLNLAMREQPLLVVEARYLD